MKVRIISKKSKRTRQSGHYWVKWAGLLAETNIWRMGVYYADTGTWKLINDDRDFYDRDFLEINENRIPFCTGAMLPVFWVWVAGAAYVIGSIIYIILILKGVTK